MKLTIDIQPYDIASGVPMLMVSVEAGVFTTSDGDFVHWPRYVAHVEDIEIIDHRRGGDEEE